VPVAKGDIALQMRQNRATPMCWSREKPPGAKVGILDLDTDCLYALTRAVRAMKSGTAFGATEVTP